MGEVFCYSREHGILWKIITTNSFTVLKAKVNCILRVRRGSWMRKTRYSRKRKQIVLSRNSSVAQCKSWRLSRNDINFGFNPVFMVCNKSTPVRPAAGVDVLFVDVFGPLLSISPEFTDLTTLQFHHCWILDVYRISHNTTNVGVEFGAVAAVRRLGYDCGIIVLEREAKGIYDGGLQAFRHICCRQ